MTDYLTPDEVAVLLRVDRKTVYAALHDGRLPALRLGRTFRIRREDLAALTHEPGGMDAPAAGPRLPRRPRPADGRFANLAREV